MLITRCDYHPAFQQIAFVGPISGAQCQALTRSATPAFKHTINVVANYVSGIHAANSLHEKTIVFRMPVADACHHRRS